MSNEIAPAYRRFYRQLLALYPKAFRERFGESMEQTFDDICSERKERPAGMFGFALRMSVDTGTGIIKEHILQFTQRSVMSDTITDLKSAAIISFLLVLPFMVLEVVNRRNLPESFPIPLFVFMWLLPTAFIVILMPLARNLRAGNSIMANPIGLLLRVVFLALITMLLGYSLTDQLPCFLGVPNCD